MKYFFHLFSLGIVLVFTSCTKEQSQLISERTFNPQVDSLITFLKMEIPDHISKLDLGSIKPLQYQKQNIGYQIFTKSNSKKFLVIKKDGSIYSGNWVDLTELNKGQLKKHSGKIHLSSLGDDVITDLIIKNNKIIQVEKWDKSLSRKIVEYPRGKGMSAQNGNSKMNGTNLQEVVVLPEVIIEVHDADYWSLFWLFNEYSPFSYFYKEEDITGFTGGGGGYSGESDQNDNVVAVPVNDGPKNPIKNIRRELKCLTINPNSTYSISINVNQPRPDSRDKVDPSNNFMAGHTFLTLEQNNPDGTKVIRNIGFYPENSVYPGNFEDESIFGEDSETPFAVSLKMTVTGQEMNTVVNSLIAQQSLSYNLENSNCVSSVISSLQKINIQLPTTSSGIENLFKGVNPGDFGQDIRNLDLDKFGKDNGNRKVERKTSKKNDLQPSGKKGSC